MAFEKFIKKTFFCRWMQEADLDLLDICSSPKGFGKSSLQIQQARYYSHRFGLICPKCNHKFYFTGKFFTKDTGHQFKKIFTKHDQDETDDELIQSVKELDSAVDEIVVESCPKCGAQAERMYESDFRMILAYDNDEIEDKIHNLPPYSPLLADEAVRFMMGENWNAYEAKQMKRLVAQIRPKHLIFMANIPKFGWMDRKYRCDMATCWLRILRRKLGIMMIPDLGETDDPWHMKKFQEMLGSYYFFTTWKELERKAKYLVNHHPCVYDWFTIPQVPQHIYAQYLKIRNEKVFTRKKQDAAIDQKALAKVAAYNLINRYDEFIGAVKSTRKSQPTLKILEQFIFSHPKTEVPMARYTTLRNWIAELRPVLKNWRDKGEVEI